MLEEHCDNQGRNDGAFTTAVAVGNRKKGVDVEEGRRLVLLPDVKSRDLEDVGLEWLTKTKLFNIGNSKKVCVCLCLHVRTHGYDHVCKWTYEM